MSGDGAPIGFRIAYHVVPRIPRRVALAMADVVGTAASLVAPRRQAVRANLRHGLGAAAPRDEISRVTRQIFRTQARNYVDLLHLRRLTARDIENLVDLEGDEEMANAVARGRGAILVSGHFANLDVAAQRLAGLGYPITAVIERIEPPSLLRMLTDLRGRAGMRFVPADEAATAVLRLLRDGELVYLSADLDVAGGGTTAVFFGEPARVPDAYARLALRRGAVLFFVKVSRRTEGRFRCVLIPVAVPESTGDRASDVAAIVDRVLTLFEAQILEDPGQWVMFRPMWR